MSVRAAIDTQIVGSAFPCPSQVMPQFRLLFIRFRRRVKLFDELVVRFQEMFDHVERKKTLGKYQPEKSLPSSFGLIHYKKWKLTLCRSAARISKGFPSARSVCQIVRRFRNPQPTHNSSTILFLPPVSSDVLAAVNLKQKTMIPAEHDLGEECLPSPSALPFLLVLGPASAPSSLNDDDKTSFFSRL